MNKMRKLVILIMMILLAMTPSTGVIAASTQYVPTSIVMYEGNSSIGWLEETKSTYTYNKNGWITKSVSSMAHGETGSVSYKWKKNLLTKVSRSSGGDITFKYKNGLLKKAVETNKDGKTTYTYKWKKNTANVKVTSTLSNNQTSSMKIKIDKKKRPVKLVITLKDGKKTTIKNTYHSNNNLKSSETVSADGSSTKSLYNKQGYVTLRTYKYANGNTAKTTFNYTMDAKKKCPSQVIVKVIGGESDGTYRRVVFSSFKKVKQGRNCSFATPYVSIFSNLPLAGNMCY